MRHTIVCQHCLRPHVTRDRGARFCSTSCARRQATGTPEQRFSQYADRSAGDTACWPWRGTVGGNGYGQLCVNGRPRSAHRVAHEMATGQTVPDGKILMHSCDNPICVNPAHLRVGTNAENTEDARRKRRLSHGEQHWKAKLSPDQVRDIRASGDRYIDLAARYGVHFSTIGFIKTRRSWQHL